MPLDDSKRLMALSAIVQTIGPRHTNRPHLQAVNLDIRNIEIITDFPDDFSVKIKPKQIGICHISATLGDEITAVTFEYLTARFSRKGEGENFRLVSYMSVYSEPNNLL